MKSIKSEGIGAALWIHSEIKFETKFLLSILNTLVLVGSEVTLFLLVKKKFIDFL